MESGKTNTLVIKTPEGIRFSLHLASPVTRFLAYAVDLACVMVASGILSGLIRLFGVLSVDLAQAMSVLMFFVLQIGYSIASEWYWRGQTVGKRLFRLRVINLSGMRLKSDQVVMRNLLRFIDMLPAFYLVGGVACLLSKRAQRLGDLAANTIVIRTPKILEPNLDQLLGGRYNSLRDHPHLEARLRQRVSPQEATIALQSLLRRDELEPAARVQLFAELANYFKTMVEFPPETVEGMPDEQYIRNLVDVLYRPRAGTSRDNSAKAQAVPPVI